MQVKQITVNFEKVIKTANDLSNELRKDRVDPYNSRVISQSLEQGVKSLRSAVESENRVNILQFCFKIENAISKAESQLKKVRYRFDESI